MDRVPLHVGRGLSAEAPGIARRGRRRGVGRNAVARIERTGVASPRSVVYRPLGRHGDVRVSK